MDLEFRESRIQNEPGQRRLDARASGAFVGEACWSVREMLDRAGARRRLGFLQHLEVAEAFRRRGYGTRLLEQALMAMHREQCEWALALPSEAAGDFYAQLGWRPVPLQVCEGTPYGGNLSQAFVGYVVRQYDPARESAGWAALAELHSADATRWQLAMLRDADYWTTHVAACVSGDTAQVRPAGTFFVAARAAMPAELVGYVLLHWWHLHPECTCYFEVTELCARPGDEHVEDALLAEIDRQAAAQECRMAWGRLFLPREPRIERAIALVLRDPEWSTFRELRAQPLTDQADSTWFAAPGAACWSLDVE
jgi:hypothetical protein